MISGGHWHVRCCIMLMNPQKWPEMHTDKSNAQRLGEQDRVASLTYADGYADGEAYRARNQNPPAYLLLGFDEYAQGFQAGYHGDSGLKPKLGAHVTVSNR